MATLAAEVRRARAPVEQPQQGGLALTYHRLMLVMLLFVGVTLVIVGIYAELNQAELTTLGELMQAGKMTPVIDRRYSMSEDPAAMEYIGSGHARGKVVVNLEAENVTSVSQAGPTP